MQLHADGRVDELARDHPLRVGAGREHVGVAVVPHQHAARVPALEAQFGHQGEPRAVEGRGDAASLVVGVHRDLDAVEPVALGIVVRQAVIADHRVPAEQGRVGRTPGPHGGGGAHHDLGAILTGDGHELAFREALELLLNSARMQTTAFVVQRIAVGQVDDVVRPGPVAGLRRDDLDVVNGRGERGPVGVRGGTPIGARTSIEVRTTVG